MSAPTTQHALPVAKLFPSPNSLFVTPFGPPKKISSRASVNSTATCAACATSFCKRERKGNLVPSRDLVYFVEPSVREQAYLHNLREVFAAASRAITGSECFRAWATDLVGAAAGDLERWGDFLDEDPVLAVVLRRFLTWAEISLPAHVPVPVEAREPLSLQRFESLAFEVWM